MHKTGMVSGDIKKEIAKNYISSIIYSIPNDNLPNFINKLLDWITLLFLLSLM